MWVGCFLFLLSKKWFFILLYQTYFGGQIRRLYVEKIMHSKKTGRAYINFYNDIDGIKKLKEYCIFLSTIWKWD